MKQRELNFEPFHAVGAAPNAGATADELDAFEAGTGLSLTPQVRAFYGSTNGLTIIGGGWMEILVLAEVMPNTEGMWRYGSRRVCEAIANGEFARAKDAWLSSQRFSLIE